MHVYWKFYYDQWSIGAILVFSLMLTIEERQLKTKEIHVSLEVHVDL